MFSMEQTLADSIKAAVPEITDKLITVRKARIIEKHVNALDAVWDLRDKTRKELNKLKPDHVTLDDTGKEVEKSWTKVAYKTKKDLEDKIARIEKALSNALDSGDYSEVYKLAGNGGKDRSGDTEESSD